MKNIEIKIDRNTRMVDLSKTIIGNDSENLQGKIVFSFVEDFVDGQARLHYEINGKKNWVALDKVEETYELPIKSVLTKKGQIDMQLVITEGVEEENVPIFKSNKFYMYCNSSINAIEEEPIGYDSWLEIANTKLNQIDNLDVNLENNVLTVTKKDGSTQSQNVKGDTYEITEEDYNIIENEVKTDLQPILENIENIAKQAEVIAKGRATGYVFDTVEDMEMWLLDENNRDNLIVGDHLYIIEKNVPDYWWDGKQTQILETEKPDLTEYAKKEQFVTLTQKDYDKLEIKDANTYYFIIEEE